MTVKAPIIPIGFRCFTKYDIFKQIGFDVLNLPFNNGFFPQEAIISILENPIIDIEKDHSVCIKREYYQFPNLETGIKFYSSTYEKIDQLVDCATPENINSYLDSTMGYYTWDRTHNYVLAHYNWHIFANKTDIKTNMKSINDMLNRRIKRMFELCFAADYLFLFYEETQKYRCMVIDNIIFELGYKKIRDAFEKTFKKKCLILML